PRSAFFTFWPSPAGEIQRQSGAFGKKASDFVDEGVELVVMHPMPGLLESDDAGGAEMLGAAVLERVRSPALLAIDEQRRAGDPAPELDDLRIRHVIGRPGPDVVVELPAIGAVLVLIHAMLGQVPRLLGREVAVRFLH